MLPLRCVLTRLPGATGLHIGSREPLQLAPAAPLLQQNEGLQTAGGYQGFRGWPQAVETADDAALDGCLSAPVGGAAIRRAAAAVPGPVAEAVLAAAYARFRC